MYEYVYDFTSARTGVPFRAVVEGDKVEFYDRRYNFTEHGQFTGARYYVSTLLEAAETLGRRGLNLHGGVDDWKVDATSMTALLEWLERTEQCPTSQS